MMDLVMTQGNSQLFDRVVSILDQARQNVVSAINAQMVVAYWMIGHEIVEEEQKGEKRAEYGRHLMETLSAKLTERYGKGFSTTNLRNFRQFYLIYPKRLPKIHYPVGSKSTPSKDLEKLDPDAIETGRGFDPRLGWSHYRVLMRVDSSQARCFYETEAVKNHWGKRELERQVHSLYFERLLKSRGAQESLELAEGGQSVEKPIDAIKEPYVLEFLDLPESHQLNESDLETALINHLQEFLLELGSGFAFVGRQKRLTLDGDHFYPDLIFYHIRLKCFVIIDLKVAKLTGADLAQMQMFVHYYDQEIKSDDDNPTLGLILCTDKNDAVVKYVLGDKADHIFARRYKLALPSEEELRRELGIERQAIIAKGVENTPED